MRAADPEDIAFACATQLLFDVTDTVDRIACNSLEWDRRSHGACDHSRRKLWFGCKAGIGGHVCAASRRSGSSVHSFGRYSARSMNA